MSQKIANLKQIEDLDVNQLAEALELNGYAECVEKIRTKYINGEAFLNLSERQISLWRLPSPQAHRLWSFIQQVQQDPKQFLMNTQTTNKTAPKMNTLHKPSTNHPVTNSLLHASRFLGNKPNVAVKPNISNQFQKSVQKSETDVESNFAVLTKEESKLFKNKLEQVFKNNSSKTPSNSFIYNQKLPPLPPRPDHITPIAPANDEFEESPDDFKDGFLLRTKADPNQRNNKPEVPPLPPKRDYVRPIAPTNDKFEESPDDFKDGYLLPRKVDPNQPNNESEEQNNKPPKTIVHKKPLPPIPVATKQKYAFDNKFETDEVLPEYTSAPDNKKLNTSEERKVKEGISLFHRPLPPVPSTEVNKSKPLLEVRQWNNEGDDEESTKYTAAVQDEIDAMQSIIDSLCGVSSPLNIPASSAQLISANQSFRTNEGPTVLSPDSNEEELTRNLQTMSLNKSKAKSKSPVNPFRPFDASTKLLKPFAELTTSPATLPKSSANPLKPRSKLPIRPMDLSSLDNFLMNSQDDLPDFDFSKHLNEVEDKPWPSPPPMEVDEPAFYSEIDIARESSYRETDRWGARQMLNGLEDGAFVIRPSTQPQYVCTFSIMYNRKMFNLGIKRDSEGALGFASVTPDFNQPKLYTVGEMVTYYSTHPLYLFGEFILLKDVLPRTT